MLNLEKAETRAGGQRAAFACGQTIRIAAVGSAAAPSEREQPEGRGRAVGCGEAGGGRRERRGLVPGITTDIVFSMKSAPT